MSCRLPPHKLAAIAMAVSASLASMALAQTEPATGPGGESDTIYFGQRPQAKLPSFWIAPPHAIAEFNAYHTRTDTSTEGGEDTETRETLFQEQLTLFSNGYVVHPNLVDFRFSVTGGLSQGWFEDEDDSGSSTGTIYGWDTAVIFLRNEPGNLTLYSRRNESILDVPFGPTMTTTTMRTGAVYNYRSRDNFATLEAFTEEETQRTHGSDENDFSLQRNAFTGSGQSYITPNQTLDWSFLLEDVTYDNFGGDSNEQSIAGSLGHSVNFGDGDRNSLSSGVSYSQTEGDLDRSDLRWTEHLHLYHTPDFETNYDYRYERLTYGNGTTDHHQAYMDARHQLYRSLQTVGRIGYEKLGADESSIDIYTADLTLNYRKEVPYGVLMADARTGYEMQEFSGAGDVFVGDSPAAFVGLDPITVSQTTIVPDSVLIRDALTGRTYVEGVDYNLRPTPAGLEIDRVLGGNITAGQPLLLSYSYDPQDADQIETNYYGIGGRYQILRGPLAGFAPYARFYGQDQTVSGGTAPPNSVRDYIAGLEYQRGALLLSAEREWYDSTLYPFDAWRYEARYTHRLSGDTTASGTVTYTQTEYSDPHQETSSLGLNANVAHRFSTRLYGSAYVAYALVDTTGGGETTGFEQGLELNWTYRQTKVYMRVRNSTLDSDLTDQQFQFFQLGVSRFF